MSNSNENEIANYSSYVQHGDYDAIKDLIRRKNNLNAKQYVVSANYIDNDGCSLVQWAAVNNRFNIMNLLIDNDADLLYSGGLLGENCLQWAMRGRYYHMVEMLARKNHHLLDHKNKMGYNSLMLSFELKDWHLMLLILLLGADPNARLGNTSSSSTNGNSNPSILTDTVLLAMLKKDCSHEVVPYIILLLKFGADPGLCDNDGENAFHVIASHSKTNLYLAYKLFECLPKTNRNAVYAKNHSGQAAYDLTRMKHSSKMSKFFIDLLIFHTLPYYTPMLSAALSVMSFFYLISSMGFIYGFGVWLLIFAIGFRSVMQLSLTTHTDRAEMGATLGVALSWFTVFVFEIYSKSYVSESYAAVGLTFFFLAVLFAVLFHTRSPDREKSLFDSRVSYARSSSGSSGNNGNGVRNSSDTSTSEMNKSLMKRVLAMAPTEGTYEEFEQSLNVNQLFSPTPLFCDIGCLSCLTAAKRANHFTAHCRTCDACVIDKDFHISFLGNCSGKGNRRYLVLFVMSCMVCLALYAYASSIVFCKMCPNAKGMLWGSVAVGTCVFNKRVDMLMLFGMACMILFAFSSLLMQQLSLIAAQSSMEHYRRLGGKEAIYHPKFGLTVSLCFTRIMTFFCTGQYTISAVFHDDADTDEDKYGLLNNNNSSSTLSNKEDKIKLEERQEEFLLQNRGGGPEVDYSDEEEMREFYQKLRMKNKKCCNRNHDHSGSSHSHESGEGDASASYDNGQGSGSSSANIRLPNAMQMDFADRV